MRTLCTVPTVHSYVLIPIIPIEHYEKIKFYISIPLWISCECPFKPLRLTWRACPAWCQEKRKWFSWRPGTSALPRSVSPPSFYVHNEPIIVKYTLDLVLLLSQVQYHLLSMGTMNLLLYSTTHNHLIHLLLSIYTMKFSLYSTVHNKLTIV